MSYALTVPKDYGYVILISSGIVPLVAFGHGLAVGSLRKAAKVPYPNTYATHEQAEKSKDAYKFNCAQRAHANFLENMPQAIATMLVGGLAYPRTVAVLGLGWVATRILFGYGYITSNKPQGQGRYVGVSFWLFQAAIWGTAIATGLKLLGN